MIKKFLNSLFATKSGKFVDDTKPGGTEHPVAKKETPLVDPLDPLARQRGWPMDGIAGYMPELRKVTEFPTFDGLAGEPLAVGDAALAKKVSIMDDSAGDNSAIKGGRLSGGRGGPMEEWGVSEALNMWYLSQGFIGYQMCAMIAQHWLVDKACSMSGEDAVRNGWYLSNAGGDDLDKEQHDAFLKADKALRIREQIVEFNRFKNIFGIRVAIFKVKSDDPLYYEKPFNIDGVAAESYEGISQVDPYWMTPVMSSNGANDPSQIGFYEPQYWIINGKKYHISHLAIARGPQPADILKPTYIFGGISLVQRIYERVYAAERTANEAPLMAMSKRTMAIHADLDKVMANQCEFEERLALWIKYRDNHGVKVLGTEESMEQFDTAMTDFDSIIMNQYQIVAAIARVPSTKLLGTSPKGFNATGEFEARSYHEELESVQEHVMMPMLERHYEILARSLGIDTEINIVCNPVDSVTTKERADLNKLKADTGIELINAGVISPEEERSRLKDDEHSGYDRLPEDVEAEEDPGMSPENLANLEKAGAASTAAENPPAGSTLPGGPEAPPDTAEQGSVVTPGALQALIPLLLQSAVSKSAQSANMDPAILAALVILAAKMGVSGTEANPIRGVKPSVKGTVQRHMGIDSGEVLTATPVHKLPKLRLHGLNIVIENPRGTVRVGEDLDGRQWASEMPDHYGFIRGYEGTDGEDVDCFIGPDLMSDSIYVICQKFPDTGQFDEYKCMIGYESVEHAIETYRTAYSDEWDGFDNVLPPMSVEEFKSWLEGGGGGSTAVMVDDEEFFKESDHPRKPDGKFGSGGGGGGSVKPSAKKPAAAPATKTATISKGAGSLKAMPANRDEWPAHVKALKLPPAWTDVKAASDPKAGLLAVGKDAKGRPQYVYSKAFSDAKTDEKFGRIRGMNDQIGGMNAKNAADRASDDVKVRNTADSMALVMGMGLRPGSDTDTKAEKKAYGASNLEARHVKVDADGNVTLDFTGKKGVDLKLPVKDAGLADMLKSRKASAGGDDARLFGSTTDKSLLDYAHTLGSGDFKTKDFRTFVGTSTATDEIKSMPVPTTEKEYIKAVKEVGKRVSTVLGNTPTIALQSYIDPTVFSSWKAALT